MSILFFRWACFSSFKSSSIFCFMKKLLLVYLPINLCSCLSYLSGQYKFNLAIQLLVEVNEWARESCCGPRKNRRRFGKRRHRAGKVGAELGRLGRNQRRAFKSHRRVRKIVDHKKKSPTSRKKSRPNQEKIPLSRIVGEVATEYEEVGDEPEKASTPSL